MEYRIAFGCTIPAGIASRMDNCSSFFEVHKMVNIMGLYMHAQVWLADRLRQMAEDEL